jgi:hypothetical protein
MKEKINFYFAILVITVFGAGATLLIVRVATANTAPVVVKGSEASYTSLQTSILKTQLGR